MPNSTSFPIWAKPINSYSRPQQPNNKVLHVTAQNVHRNVLHFLENVDLNSSHVWLLTEMATHNENLFLSKLRTDYPTWKFLYEVGKRTAILVHPSISHTLEYHSDHLCTIRIGGQDNFITCMYGSNVSTERQLIVNELKTLLSQNPTTLLEVTLTVFSTLHLTRGT